MSSEQHWLDMDNDVHKKAAHYTQILMAIDAAQEHRDSAYSQSVVGRMTLAEIRELLPDVAELGGFVDSLNRAMAGEKLDFVDRHHVMKIRRKMQSHIDASTLVRQFEAQRKKDAEAAGHEEPDPNRFVFL